MKSSELSEELELESSELLEELELESSGSAFGVERWSLDDPEEGGMDGLGVRGPAGISRSGEGDLEA